MSNNPAGLLEESLQKFERYSVMRKHAQKIGLFPEWYTTQGYQMYVEKYAYESEDGIRDRFWKVAKTLARHMIGREEEWSNRFFNILWRGKLSPATPALSNTGTNRGMPVSCSGQVIDDNVPSFFDNLKRMALLSKHGFGTSGDFSKIRPRGKKISTGGKANGPVDTIDMFFNAASKISQGGNRRGSFAAYLDIEHDNWDEAADSLFKSPNGKNYGWVVRDSFVERLKAGDLDAHRRFGKFLYIKLVTGKGYIFCVDKANRHRPAMYKKWGLDIVATNLCTEIMLHSSNDYDYSCILASLNLVHADELMDPNDETIFESHVFLDCLCSEFIEVSEGVEGLEKVRAFTIMGRAVGLGVMGLHTYFQMKSIPYISLEAEFFDGQLFKRMHDETLRASQWLAQEYGEPEWCKGFGVRNTHRTALAPTKSTANLMGGVSESWMPDPAIIWDAGSSVGELRRICGPFYELMKERGQYTPETIQSIIDNVGSVQHLDWLTEHEKLVYLNAFEMDQEILRRRASKRQKHLCQGQSLNFFVSEDGCEEQVSRLITKCVLDENCFSQYYIYSRSGVVVRDECVACSA